MPVYHKASVYLALSIVWLTLVITTQLGFMDSLELSAYDLWFRLRGVVAPSSEIVIVEIDDKSIGEIGRLPWPRRVHADLLDVLKEARVVGFDLLFDAPSTPEDDSALAEAIATHGRVVLSSAFTFHKEAGEWFQELQQPIPELAVNAAAVGFINVPTDIDNVVRGVIPIDLNAFGKPYPSFATAVVVAYLGLTPEQLTYRPRELKLGAIRIPLDGENQVRIDFAGPARSFPTYRYSDVLYGKVEHSIFRDKIVLVGVSSPLSQDYFQTPFTRGNLVLEEALPTPGVEVHANAINTILSGRYLTRVPKPLNLLSMLMAGLATAAIASRFRPWTGLAAVILMATAVTAVGFGLWLIFRTWLDIVAPNVFIFSSYTVITLSNFIKSEGEKRHIRELFGRYVSREVVAELLKNPQGVTLGGKRQEVTILFSDIRGFTSFSEAKPPEEVVERLNRYLAEMTKAIFRYGGTLDKYLGDGIMAVFGAPLRYEDHPQRAVRAALDMVSRLEELNREWAMRGAEPFSIGIGINTGNVLVGNVGSPDRMEYTVIGEAVNLAARLEGLNKELGTSIIISANTYSRISPNEIDSFKGSVKITPLGQLRVRGFAQLVEAYAIIWKRA